MARLPHLLILLLLTAIPLAAQSKAKQKPAVAKRPFYRAAQVSQGKPYYRPIQPPANAAQLNKALTKAIGGAKADILIARAKYYLAAGLEDSARREFDRALLADPEDVAVLIRVATQITSRRLKDGCKNVITMSSNYLAKHPNNDAVLNERAKAKSCLGDPQGAFDDVSLASTMAPQNRSYWYDKLNYLRIFKNTDNAEVLYQKVIDELEAQMPATPPSRYSYQVFPKNILALAFAERAAFHKKIGNKEAELADLGRAVEIFPLNYLLTRAYAYRERKMYAEAVSDIERAIDLTRSENMFPMRTLPEIYWLRADIFVLMGKFNEAIADYKTVNSLRPNVSAIIEAKIAAVKEMMNK
ncbi:MAG TPA: hypothetical protein PLP21_14965 [Pyrinomonadaceae bacterium]|nr:hypothetical protein [Acidobacteriota bacterium]HQZ97621.1 hypothetical protein [Pyrinomonadaceae bacterium]